ncbi:hypothetical protein HJC23_005796 [Cyclotella cryptica]|uniref:Selenoprotein O n=1 Tax=Cyclotella cryptica TaxID=29204 RepID=A0ABD3NL11_9STRA
MICDAASAFSSFKPDLNERGAAFIANHRSRRRPSLSEDSSVASLNKGKHGIHKSSHGRFAGDMKRPIFQTSALVSLKRSFTGNSVMSCTESVAAASSASDASAADEDRRKYPPLTTFFQSFHHSYLSHLSAETPSNLEKSLALQLRLGGSHPGRPIYNGHYVRVRPTPLTNPKLVIYSREMAKELRLSSWEVQSEAFVKYFSGDVEGATADHEGIGEVETWATPYALSIMGRRYTNNCPYGTGDGYGDGRAISIGEVLIPKRSASLTNGDISQLYPVNASRFELQLKGAGQTPFFRGADGRAVLRSSIREFLASEAMHHLGISTTRALSLIVSDGPEGNKSMRPWYSSGGRKVNVPSMDDPRLAQYSDKEKREIISQLSVQAKADPDTMVEEKCAITTRVATSFVRVGHLDLFARRVEMVQQSGDEGIEVNNVKDTEQYRELEDMMWHACYREYYDEAYAPYWEMKDATSAALALMKASMKRIAEMVAGWVRVGFVQGNFNADNCLVGGRTMDYGPFGFLDVYHPLSAKWTGSGDHFGFMNQPKAGFANFAVLVESLLPIIDANGSNADEIRDEILVNAQKVFSHAVDKAINSKLGLELSPPEMAREVDELWEEIEPLLRTARADWTLFWRQLTYVAAEFSPTKSSISEAESHPDFDRMMENLLGNENTNPFYDPLSDEHRESLLAWLQKWHKTLVCAHKHAISLPSSDSILPPEERMRLSNPKYTLREWMLVEAYTKADGGKFVTPDFSLIHELYSLTKDPYGEGSAESHEKYYRRAPDESLRAGGTAFMS